MIIDFEGEPARSLTDRRRKRSPLRDVAGMLRSFAYAATAAELLRGTPAPDGWEEQAREQFLDGYLATVDPSLLPSGQAAIERLLAVFELEKAVYELRYELDNRPDWVGIPVAGIQRLIERAAALPVIELGADPHSVLGAHEADDGGVVVRAYRRRRSRCASSRPGVEAELNDPSGLWEALLPKATLPLDYELEIEYANGDTFTLRDPYAFLPTLGELDLHLVGEGRHEELYERLGAHVREIGGVTGTAFAVWAPNARSVSVVGDFNSWDGRLHPMRSLGSSGIWELFVPGVQDGAKYKFEVRTQDGRLRLKADPVAFAAEVPPRTRPSSTARRTSGPTTSGSHRGRRSTSCARRSRSTRCISARGAATRSTATAR